MNDSSIKVSFWTALGCGLGAYWSWHFGEVVRDFLFRIVSAIVEAL